MPELDLLTSGEVAEIVGVSGRQMVDYLRTHDPRFPKAAIDKPGVGRLWHRKDIEAYQKKREEEER